MNFDNLNQDQFEVIRFSPFNNSETKRWNEMSAKEQISFVEMKRVLDSTQPEPRIALERGASERGGTYVDALYDPATDQTLRSPAYLEDLIPGNALVDVPKRKIWPYTAS